MKTLTLNNPIFINDKERKELSYDFQAITPDMFIRASQNAAKGTNGTFNVVESDYAFHLYIAFEAIIAVNKDIDIIDLKRISGLDIPQVMRIGRDFLLPSAAALKQKRSEAQSETIAESTTKAQTKSETVA